MPRQGRSSKSKGYRGEVQAVRDLNKLLEGSGLEAFRTIGSGAFATRADGHDDPYLRGDVQIRRDGTIVEYIEVKVADPNRRAGPIKIAEMDGKDWRYERRILMCRHVPGNPDWLLSMWPKPWGDLCERAGKESMFYRMRGGTRGVTLHQVQHALRGLGAAHWGAAFYMTIHKFTDMLIGAYGEEANQ